uniref:Uncharacterized protein LOC105139703 n=1 Tax=Rhizophora mucronata TaxID=61149 RepID=A0A2P2K396_RHIMU
MEYSRTPVRCNGGIKIPTTRSEKLPATCILHYRHIPAMWGHITLENFEQPSKHLHFGGILPLNQRCCRQLSSEHIL